MQITATELRNTALPQRLRFPPPYADRSSNPDGYSYWWQLFRLVFDLPDPSKFPKLSGFSDEEIIRIRRFVSCCEELAESTLLSHKVSLKLNWTNSEDGTQTEKITADFPPRESVRGTTVLFRQIYSNEELASYNAVRKIIGRRAAEQGDEHRDHRTEMQKRWNGAQGKLRAYLLTYLADKMVHDSLKTSGQPDGLALPGHDVKPEAIIRLFQYGDLIHWGSGAQEMGELTQSEFLLKWNTMHYLEVVTQLSHFYLGYSMIARKAIGD
jgi:hypothetical protein